MKTRFSRFSLFPRKKGSLVSDPKSEYEEIVSTILKKIPRTVLGKSAILEMKDEGSRNWRQMEWIGFWFEHFISKNLPSYEFDSENQFGKTKFDLSRDFLWDLKAHPNQVDKLILNDRDAIQTCLLQRGGLGFIILSGDVVYDESGEFKTWHDNLKGGVSTYEHERVSRKAPSRKRKISFTPTSIEGFWFNSFSQIEDCINTGVMGEFQKGMRNSNGVARNSKIIINKFHELNTFSLGSVPFH